MINVSRALSVSTRDASKPYYWLQKWKNVSELSEHLTNNILYKDDHIVAFNKPNGVPMYSPKYDENTNIMPSQLHNFLSVDNCRQHLIKKFGVEEMHSVLSQNRMHSGIIVFCFDKKLSQSLSHYFKNAKINKHCLSQYELVCLGRNNRNTGSMTLHIAQMMINGNIMSVEDDRFQLSRKIKSNASLFKYDLVNKSKVAFNCSVSHMKVLTSSVKWDALEIFAVKGMTPILGDHKYSSRIRTILDRPIHMNPEEVLPHPQDVPKDICDLLEVDTNMTEDIPLHVHCSKLVLPQIFKTKNGLHFSRECLQNDLQMKKSDDNPADFTNNSLVISAPQPPAFTETLRRLKLS